MKFSLRTLLWIVAMCAFAAWLLSLPPVVISLAINRDSLTGAFYETETPAIWLQEVCIRLGFAILIGLLPILIRRPKKPGPN